MYARAMTTPRKVLCSIGVGWHAELLAISSQTFRYFARQHGYDLCLRGDHCARERPVAWSKVLLIHRLLESYDVVLWIDADAAVTDASHDISDLLGSRDLMALVAHSAPGHPDPMPNTGVWLLRQHWRTRRFLRSVWASTHYIDHDWWENAAVAELLGYDLQPRVRLARRTAIYRRTRFLPAEWNSIPLLPSPAPRIRHFPRPDSPSARIAGVWEATEALRRLRSADDTLTHRRGS